MIVVGQNSAITSGFKVTYDLLITHNSTLTWVKIDFANCFIDVVLNNFILIFFRHIFSFILYGLQR
jgi:hypothetical protein